MEETNTHPLRVSIVEDHDIFRKRLTELLGFYDELKVVLVADSAETFLNRIEHMNEQESPQVVLMDIELPGISGIEATYQLGMKFPDMNVIMFTVFEDDERIFDSIQVGASGYLLKDTPIETVVESIREITQGGSPISPTIARKVLGMMKSADRPHTKEEQEVPFDLTPSERNILDEVVKGKTNKEIAEEVHLSPWTVKTHIRNIYRKMQVNTRAAAVRLAINRKII